MQDDYCHTLQKTFVLAEYELGNHPFQPTLIRKPLANKLLAQLPQAIRLDLAHNMRLHRIRIRICNMAIL